MPYHCHEDGCNFKSRSRGKLMRHRQKEHASTKIMRAHSMSVRRSALGAVRTRTSPSAEPTISSGHISLENRMNKVSAFVGQLVGGGFLIDLPGCQIVVHQKS